MYNSIFRLKDMLDNENIPYEFLDRSSSFGSINNILYQIVVYKPNSKKERLISVVEGNYTYGGEKDLLEIMGCLTEEESEFDSVVGNLTSLEVFNRIKENYYKKPISFTKEQLEEIKEAQEYWENRGGEE